MSAQTLPESLRQDAIKLANQIEDEYLVLDENWAAQKLDSSETAPATKLWLLRNIINEAIVDAGTTDIFALVDRYRSEAVRFGTARDLSIAQFFETILVDFNPAEIEESHGSIETHLEEFLNHPDWFVQHRARYYTSLLSPNAAAPSVALQYAQDAFDVIPQDDTNYVLEARILSATNISYLHNLLGNPQLSIPTTIEAIRLKKLAGEPIDGADILSNLIFSFGMWRDHQTSKSLVETLLRLEARMGSEIPGLTEFLASNIYSELGDFEASLRYAKVAMQLNDMAPVQKGAELNRIIALAGLGRVDAAKRAFAKLQNTMSEEEQNKGSAVRKILYIKALIALAEGDKSAAQQYMNERVDANVQRILSWNNSETANMLAALHNSKERRTEREDALEREAGLKQVALDRQRRVIWLLFVLAGIMTVLSIGAVAFARFRSQAAKDMTLAAEKARAGEKAKSDFLAVMSHELRTPLNGILGMADALSRASASEEVRSKNAVILKSGNELLSLVENIFDMTMIENGELTTYAEPLKIRDLILRRAESWREQIEAKNIIYTVHVDPSVPDEMELDRNRFTQCLNNLLSNATKFTMAGRIHVHVTCRPVEIDGAPKAELSIIVADTGVGISEDAKTRLFMPFVQADSSITREYGGAGLGLAITRSLARMMGGDLVAMSREGRGSEFTLTLTGQTIQKDTEMQGSIENAPELTRETETETNSNPPVSQLIIQDTSKRAPLSLRGKNILVVDDDIACQQVVETLLRPTHAAVMAVSSAQEAFDVLAVQPFDVVVMDIRMPSMDGITAVRRIRQSTDAFKNVSIIALTADVAVETNASCMIAGVDIFLTKPVRASDFYEAIEIVQEKRRPANRQVA